MKMARHVAGRGYRIMITNSIGKSKGRILQRKYK
jgi:hypothetical protein